MPMSSHLCKARAIEWIQNNVDVHAKILDVGPGIGTYGKLLSQRGYDNIDAVEIYQPYIDKYLKDSPYKRVCCMNVMDFDFEHEWYDLVILGDILEHLSESDARRLLDTLVTHVRCILVSVPYHSKQGTYEGNIYEAHLQPELDHQRFMQLYPEFTCICEKQNKYDHIALWVWVKS